MIFKSLVTKTLLFFSVSSVLLTSNYASAVEGEILVTLVRHADISMPARERDPDLAPAGTDRAAVLGDIVRERHVDAVFSTEYLRTRHTAEIAAVRAGAIAKVFGATHQGDLISEIKDNYVGKSVLIVGHSNTVPAIIEALGGPSLPNIDEAEFDNIFQVKIIGSHVEFVQSKYGAPSVLPTH
jgi:phosphohistidine phosphatase SixA